MSSTLNQTPHINDEANQRGCISMSQSHIPNGCYSIKTVAEKLGIREENVLRKMRLRGWLYKGIFRKDPLTDMPLPEAIENGFVKKIKRNSLPPYDWDIAITAKGMTD